jgi:hypothetical protein
MTIRTGLTRDFNYSTVFSFPIYVIVRDGIFANGTVAKSIYDEIDLQANPVSLTDKILEKILKK